MMCKLDFWLEVRDESYIWEVGIASEFRWNETFYPSISIFHVKCILGFNGCIEEGVLILKGRDIDSGNDNIGTCNQF